MAKSAWPSPAAGDRRLAVRHAAAELALGAVESLGADEGEGLVAAAVLGVDGVEVDEVPPDRA